MFRHHVGPGQRHRVTSTSHDQSLTKFERNRTIRGSFIDNFAIFAHVMSRCDLDL